MTDSEQKLVNVAFRLPERSRDALAGRLKTEGHKVQWFLEQCAMFCLREGRPPWEAAPAPNPDEVGLGQGTEYSSDVASTLDKIYERSPVVARALEAYDRGSGQLVLLSVGRLIRTTEETANGTVHIDTPSLRLVVGKADLDKATLLGDDPVQPDEWECSEDPAATSGFFKQLMSD